ncbi:MAG: cell division protein ZapB [Treponema sp.]|nr:cell division protein ZapB [Treponema sp.]
MISFDQVLLLQKKVESAVQKIVELKTENDALRSKCSELTNALSEKTELLNSFTADEQKIETSIKDALNQLNSIENTIVNQSGSTGAPASKTEQAAPVSKPAPQEKPVSNPAPAKPAPSNPAQSDLPVSEEETSEPEEKFDIF